ncbi:MAG: pyroglutamyl-peptidase I [Burkholderiales bacterium]
MRALVTGFDPFGGDAINPSYEAVRRLPARIGTLDVATAELPTSFRAATPKLRALIKRERPDIVLCVGLAADRNVISVERIAVNLAHARVADNDGARPVEKPVIVRAPAAYFSTLPVHDIVAALMHKGLNAEMSLSAGTFVCNHVFYGLMHLIARRQRETRVLHAGFVHVPALPSTRAAREVRLHELVEALEIVLDVTRRCRTK